MKLSVPIPGFHVDFHPGDIVCAAQQLKHDSVLTPGAEYTILYSREGYQSGRLCLRGVFKRKEETQNLAWASIDKRDVNLVDYAEKDKDEKRYISEAEFYDNFFSALAELVSIKELFEQLSFPKRVEYMKTLKDRKDPLIDIAIQLLQ